MLKIGDKAPDFKLPNQDEINFSLADFKGHNIVLYFYPKDNTPGCITEACEFTGSLKDFEKLDAVVLGLSPDSPKSHRGFIEKQSLGIDLLSDVDHKVLETYGAWGEKAMYGKTYMGVIRSTFLIDKEGKIAQIWRNVKVLGHVSEVKKALESVVSL